MTPRDATAWMWIACFTLAACNGGLTYFEGNKSDPDDTGVFVQDTATPGSPDATDTPSDTDGDVDSDSDADADADADSDADTGGTTVPPVGLQDGTYVGPVLIDYEMLVPFIGGNSTCDGDVTLVVDQSTNPNVVGTISGCEWPLFDLWALALLGTVDGDVLGDVFGVSASGDDSNGVFAWNESRSGAAGTTTLDGSFSGGSFLVDDYSGSFSATRIGP